MPTRRLLRNRSSGKRIADDYVDPNSINLDDEAMLYLSEVRAARGRWACMTSCLRYRVMRGMG